MAQEPKENIEEPTNLAEALGGYHDLYLEFSKEIKQKDEAKCAKLRKKNAELKRLNGLLEKDIEETKKIRYKVKVCINNIPIKAIFSPLLY